MDINILNTVLNKMTTASQSMQGNLIAEGQLTLLTLTGIMISYHLLLALFGNDWSSTQVALFQTILKWAIVTVMLASWNSVVVDLFSNKFNDLARVASGNNTNLSNVVNMGFKTISTIFNLTGGTPPSTGEPAQYCDAMGYCQELSPLSPLPGESLGFGGWIEKALMEFVAIIIKLIAAGFVLMMLVAFIVVAFIGVFMLGVGITIGPILAPFLVIPYFEYLFNGWVKFMITGGLLKVVAAIVIAMVGVIFAEMSVLSGHFANQTALQVDLLVAFLMCLISAIGAYIMWQVPDFTNQLINGGAGIGSTQFGKGAAGSQAKKQLAKLLPWKV